MDNRRRQALRAQFDGKLKLERYGTQITHDASLSAFRELDEAFRWTERGSTVWADPRHGKNTQHTLLAMFRDSVYRRLTDYQDVSDAERVRIDPVTGEVD